MPKNIYKWPEERLTLTRSQEMQIKAIIIMFTLQIGNIRKFDNTHFRV